MSEKPHCGVVTPEPLLRECHSCGTTLREPAEYCGLCAAEKLRRLVIDLGKPAPKCTYAVWELLDRGYTPGQVVRIKQEVRRGRAVHEILVALERLGGSR